MYDRILVPLDGSPLAERVLPYAVRLAQIGNGRLVLFQAVPEVAFLPPAERDLHKVAYQLTHQGLQVDTIVRYGDPAQLILQEAKDRQIDLIVLSTHGGSGHGRWLYGNIADSVLRRTTVPVFLLPATSDHQWPEDRPLHILVPLDGSMLAQEAISPARDLAVLFSGKLHLIQVVETPIPYAYWQAYSEAEEDLNARRAEAQQYIEDIARTLRDTGVSVETDTAVGPAAATVAALARERQIDLIVMACVGKGGAAVATLGSVATGTLQRSPVPLIFVRPKTAQQQEDAPVGTALERTGAVVTLTLNLHELDLLERGLQRILGEIHPAESVYQLAARLRQAQAALAHPRGGAPPTAVA